MSQRLVSHRHIVLGVGSGKVAAIHKRPLKRSSRSIAALVGVLPRCTLFIMLTHHYQFDACEASVGWVEQSATHQDYATRHINHERISAMLLWQGVRITRLWVVPRSADPAENRTEAYFLLKQFTPGFDLDFSFSASMLNQQPPTNQLPSR